MRRRARAIVFANHDVGVRCLAVLLAGGIEVPLVVCHEEDPGESRLFASVAGMARREGLQVALPDDANDPAFVRRVAGLEPDFLFSFYYRKLLSQALLALARRGALNMHGSLLPLYRGRAPVNWAVVRGENRTGATLHYMTQQADAGDIVDQQAVPILPDDTAFEVFNKVTVAAEIVLWRALPALLAGKATRRPQDLGAGHYFGRRQPEDGEIDWRGDAASIHNLVRGVAPPYPGAFSRVSGRTLRILKTAREPGRAGRGSGAMLYVENGAAFVDCGGGGVLRVLDAELDGSPVTPALLAREFGIAHALPLPGRRAGEPG
jgi:methionyl-tRNA formyltransferase